MSDRTFDDLVNEAVAAPVDGWDFSWFDGRATEERPPWGYQRQLGERMARASSALDLQTGGGEVVAGIPKAPPRLVATESWPPNLELARAHLAPLGGVVVHAEDDAPLPFDDESFDLVSSRHPTTVLWSEIARVLRPGGTYFAQLIGQGTNRDLYEFMMGPQPDFADHPRARPAELATAAGLEVLQCEPASLRVEFFDVGAVVHFLRKVIWTVPDFTVERYRDRLRAMDAHIREHGSFVSHSRRVLFEAKR